MVERLRTAIEKARQNRPGAVAVEGRPAVRNLPVNLGSDWSTVPALSIDDRTLELARIPIGRGRRSARDAMDMMRARLLRMLQQKGWGRIGVTASSRGCGSTTVALNLGLALAQAEDLRIVLVDLDLSAPSLATRLGCEGTAAFADVLNGSAPIHAALRRIGDSLLVLAPDAPVARPHHTGQVVETLNRLQSELSPDVIVLDLPPVNTHGDALPLLSWSEAALQVAAKHRSTAPEIDTCARLIAESTSYLGVALNDCGTRNRKRSIHAAA